MRKKLIAVALSISMALGGISTTETYAYLDKMTKTVALTDAEKAAGYKIQFVDISINCTSGTYKPFWAVSYTY